MQLKKVSSRIWFSIGIVLILLDPLLAHLSDAGIIKWPASWNMSRISPIISRTVIAGGIIFLIIAFFRAQSEKK
jgi:hypothetical protein